MNISVITSSYPRFDGDGTAPFVRSISLALNKLGNNIDIVAPYDPEVKDMGQEEVNVSRFKYAPQRNCHIMGHSRALKGDNVLDKRAFLLIIPYIISGTAALWKSIETKKSTFIHAHWSLPNGLCAWIINKIRKTPYIVSLHGSDVFVANKNFIFEKVNELVLKGAKAITACSNELFEYAESHGGYGKTHLIEWGADPAIFLPIVEKTTIRKEMNLPENAVLITSLGRLVPKKGFSVLISAFAQAEKPENTFLVIGGAGSQRDALIETSKRLGINEKLILPGVIKWKDVPAFLGASDVFALPSIRDPRGNIDGLPTVLLEAMSCGLPCIASDVGGVSLVIRSWENGVIVDPNDVSALSSTISSILSDSSMRLKLSKAARESVVEKYNWLVVAQKLNELLR